MFVRQVTYDRLVGQYHALGRAYQEARAKYTALLKEWNELITKINAKGGDQFIEQGVLRPRQPAQFTDDELKQLIQLCHPDKHGGKASATTMTTKLNAMRGS